VRDHEPGLKPAVGSEEGGQAGQRGVDQPLRAPLADGAEFRHRDRDDIGGHRHRLAVEVPAREQLARVREDHRVVRGRVDLDGEGTGGEFQRVAHGPVHLGHAAQGVGVLDLAAIAVRLADGAAGQELAQVARGGRLSGVRAGGVDARIERHVGALEGIEGERARDVRGARQAPGFGQGQPRHRGHELRAVDEGQSFFCLQHDRTETGLAQRFRAGPHALLVGALAFADEGQRQVGEGREIAARAHAALRGHHRMHAGVDHGHEKVERLRPDAAEPLGQHVRA
jgi:hypothetical protein